MTEQRSMKDLKEKIEDIVNEVYYRGSEDGDEAGETNYPYDKAKEILELFSSEMEVIIGEDMKEIPINLPKFVDNNTDFAYKAGWNNRGIVSRVNLDKSLNKDND